MTAGHVIYLGLVFSIVLAIESLFVLLSPVTTAAAAAAASSPALSQAKTDEFLRTFETSLLKVLGLKQRPRPSGQVHIPQYMLDIYDTRIAMRKPNSIKMPRNPVYAANTVRSFYNREVVDLSLGDTTSENSERMVFDVSSIHEAEQLNAAELRLYRAAAEQRQNASSSDDTHHKHRIDVYDILRPASGRQTEHIRRLLDTRMVDVSRSSWESFDVWPAVQRWRQKPHTNHGLLVDFVTATGHATSVRHVRLRRSAADTDRDWQQRMPLMVTYGDEYKTPPTTTRTKRSSRNSGRRRSGRKRNRNNGRRKYRKNKSQICRRHRLYVDFHDVRWDDWIITPPGYQAYYCHGECPHTLTDNLNSTNHAIVQTLVNSVSALAVPKPCCVPTELSPISMLYLDEYEKVVLKDYQDMVVESCGCR